MAPKQALNAYKKTEVQTEIQPVKLIHMMYERILLLLEQAEDALQQKNAKKRGESIGKAITLIAELNGSVKEDKNSEAAQFLRGMYTSILLELPKVSVTGNAEILRRSSRYIARLKKIWEETAMSRHDCHVDEEKDTMPAAETLALHQQQQNRPMKGLSVSI